ncbi:MAG: hypothetical protein Q8P32_01480 [Candidatus Komeilibacteria bacterium]|nr:hypothetical protein [Candidatus Komeilibacteria bacterium]
MIKFLIFILIMAGLVFFVWHAEISTWLTGQDSWFAGWQEKAEQETPELINQGLNKADQWWDTYGEAWADQFVAKLTDTGKAKIDQWLAKKDLNQYGDQKETAYTGGTPLFNEATGQTIERYAYLLKKFPDLISQLNLEQYLK